MSFVQGFIYCSFLEFVCVNYLGRWLHLIFSCICCIFCPSSNLTNLSSSTTRRWVQDPANSKKKENAILDVSDTERLFSACLVWKHFCMFLFWILIPRKFLDYLHLFCIMCIIRSSINWILQSLKIVTTTLDMKQGQLGAGLHHLGGALESGLSEVFISINSSTPSRLASSIYVANFRSKTVAVSWLWPKRFHSFYFATVSFGHRM